MVDGRQIGIRRTGLREGLGTCERISANLVPLGPEKEARAVPVSGYNLPNPGVQIWSARGFGLTEWNDRFQERKS